MVSSLDNRLLSDVVNNTVHNFVFHVISAYPAFVVYVNVYAGVTLLGRDELMAALR